MSTLRRTLRPLCTQRKASNGCMDYAFHMAVTSWSEKVRVCAVVRARWCVACGGVVRGGARALLPGALHCGGATQVHNPPPPKHPR